jgi:hypothetical protein
MSEMRYERQRPVHAVGPRQAVPCPEGWRHAQTGELLVAVHGLCPAKPFTEYSHDTLLAVLNGKAIPSSEWEGLEKVSRGAEPATSHEPHQAPGYTPATTTNGVQEAGQENSGGVGVDPSVFAVKEVEGGVELTVLAPYTHASTRWTIDGVAQESKGNVMVAPVGSTVVAKSAKGEFTAKV